MSIEKGRYQIHESAKYYGKFVVIDTHTNEEYPFYNLASARGWIRDQKSKPEQPTQCEYCGSTPCGCTKEEIHWRVWGDK